MSDDFYVAYFLGRNAGGKSQVASLSVASVMLAY